jgi:hypothetical protein
MLGVDTKTALDFRESFTHIAKDIRKLAKALTNRKLSPYYETIVVKQVLESKYHTMPLGVFNNR